MLRIRIFSLIFVFFTCVSSLPAIAALVITEVTVRFRIASNYMIVVPVTINGSGPYDFVLDTGSNNTMLDQKLADKLALPHGADSSLTSKALNELCDCLCRLVFYRRCHGCW